VATPASWLDVSYAPNVHFPSRPPDHSGSDTSDSAVWGPFASSLVVWAVIATNLAGGEVGACQDSDSLAKCIAGT
jgi:hypothetical protein